MGVGHVHGLGRLDGGGHPLLATAPTSLLLLTLPGGSATLVAPIVLGALLNAVLIGWCARTLRRGRNRNPHT